MDSNVSKLALTEDTDSIDSDSSFVVIEEDNFFNNAPLQPSEKSNCSVHNSLLISDFVLNHFKEFESEDKHSILTGESDTKSADDVSKNISCSTELLVKTASKNVEEYSNLESISSTPSSVISKISNDVADLMLENANLKETLKSNTKFMKNEFEKMSVWHQDYIKFQEEHKRIATEYAAEISLENEILKKSLQKFEARITELEKELSHYKEENNKLKNNSTDLELDKYKAANENLNTKIQKMKKCCQTHVTSNEYQKAKIRKLEEEKDEITRVNNELILKYSDMKSKLAAMQDDNEVLQNRIQDLGCELYVTRERNTQLQQEVQKVEKENQSLLGLAQTYVNETAIVCPLCSENFDNYDLLEKHVQRCIRDSD